MPVVDLLDFGGPRRVPMLRQAETSECGLACIAMVCAYHGLEVDLSTLRRRFGVSQRGATLKTLMGIADQVGLDVRAVRTDMDDIGEIATPAILHWNMTHFVVLAGIATGPRGKRFAINDPAHGIRSLGQVEFSRQFTGVALTLAKSGRFEPQRAKAPLRVSQLWSSIAGAGSAIAGVLALSGILQLISLVTPFYLQLGIDTVIPASDGDLLKILAIGFGGLALVETLTSWLRQLALLGMTSAFSFQIINNLYRQLLSLPLAWFEKRHVGDVISRFGSTQPITDLVSQGMVSAVIDGVMAFLTLSLMFLYSPLLASIALGVWITYVGLRMSSFRLMQQSNVSSITAGAKEASAFIESIRGISTIKSFGQERNRQRRWQDLKAAAINAQMRMGRLSAAFDAATGLVLAVERVVFVYVAIKMTLDGALTVGMIFAFQAYKQQFLGSATRLVDQAVKYRLIDVHLGRIADIALSRSEAAGDEVGERKEMKGKIELKDVAFRYGVGDPLILSNVNLTIVPGDFVAIVGPSGGGKTTLLKLIMGLLEPVAGHILIDDQPLQRFGLRAWRSKIAAIMQDDQLFAGTLAENVSFFDPEIDMEKVRQACEAAGIAAEIATMPLGFETLVGDMGSALSGGQKQRVMLARALYADPAVLFMDEGTANLDANTEAVVVESLRRLTGTRLVSAHRPMAVHAASRILLVEGGVVREVGRPAIAVADPVDADAA